MSGTLKSNNYQQIIRLLKDDDEDFGDCYDKLEAYCQRVWKTPLLPWFTDHGPKHSREIIRYFGDLYFSNLFDRALSTEELFVLLAAAHLHDLGMQDLNLDGIAISDLTEDEYNKVRERHATRSRDIIRAGGFTNKIFPEITDRLACDELPRELFDIIALVVWGHSSSTYYDALREIRSRRHDVPGYTLRIDMLTALLLFLDELHIHRLRSTRRDFAQFRPNDYSLYHHFLQYYVRNIELKYPRIAILYEYHPDFEVYADRLAHIVESKLVDQIERVNAVLTDYGILFSTEIDAVRQTSMELALPDASVLSFFGHYAASTTAVTAVEVVSGPEHTRLTAEIKRFFSVGTVPSRFVRANETFSDKQRGQIPNDLSLRYLNPNRKAILDMADDVPIESYYVWERYREHAYRLHLPGVATSEEPSGTLVDRVRDILRKHDIDVSTQDLVERPEFLLANDLSDCRRWMSIVHGDVGVGKSTLVRFVLNLIMPELLGKGFLVINVNPMTRFSSAKLASISPLDVETLIGNELRRITLDDFGPRKEDFLRRIGTDAAFRDSLPPAFLGLAEYMHESQQETVDSKQEALKILDEIGRMQPYQLQVGRLGFLAQLGRSDKSCRRYCRPILFIDNFDRTSLETQRAAVRLGKRFAQDMNCNVIIALRNRRLHKLMQSFAEEFEEYSWRKAISVEPPRLGEVFKVRTKRFLPAPPEGEIFYYKDFKINPQSAIADVLDKFLDLLLEDKLPSRRTVRRRQSKAESALLAMHNGNVRRSLETLMDILHSGENALQLDRLLSEISKEVKPPVRPVYEHIAFNNFLELYALYCNTFYTRTTSLMENLFCCGRPDHGTGNNLIKNRIMQYCHRSSTAGTDEIEVEGIYRHLIELFGYERDLIKTAMDHLLSPTRHLLWSPTGSSMKTGVTTIHFREPAKYYMRLRNLLWYICLVKDDTFVPKEVAREISFRTFHRKTQRRAGDAYYMNWTHTLKFIDYLLYCEINEMATIKLRLGCGGIAKYTDVYGQQFMMDEALECIRRYLQPNKKLRHVQRALSPNESGRLKRINDRLDALERRMQHFRQLLFGKDSVSREA